MLQVTNVGVLDERHLRIEFNDGLVHDVDCSFLFHGGLGKQLRDPDYFRLVHLDPEAGTIVWPNGLDPAPEILHGDYKLNPSVSVDERATAMRTAAEDIATATGGPFTEQKLDEARKWLPVSSAPAD